MTTSLKKKADKKSILAIAITLLLGVLVIWGVSSLFASKKGDNVEASIFSYHVVNPSQLSVEYRVKNTTKNPGKSMCSINMQDATSKYSGNDFGYESAKEIQPGETYSGVASLSISNEGAQYITKGGINCKIQ